MQAQKQISLQVENRSSVVFYFLSDVLINAVFQHCNLQSVVVF